MALSCYAVQYMWVVLGCQSFFYHSIKAHAIIEILFSFHYFRLFVLDKIMTNSEIVNTYHTSFDVQIESVLNIVILSKYKLFLPVMHV